MPVNHYLEAISKKRAAYVIARTTLEQRLREQLKEELGNLQTQVDIAVRYAYDAKLSKASILRAMGTKDYNTLNACLERTQDVVGAGGGDPFEEIYNLSRPAGSDTQVLVVTYNNHGPNNITGTATFEVKELHDGTTWFMSRDSLWNDDYTVRNEVVAALDGKQDGHYYNEAMEYLYGK